MVGSINMHYRQIFPKNIKYKYKYKFYSINSRIYKTFKNICLINIRRGFPGGSDGKVSVCKFALCLFIC